MSNVEREAGSDAFEALLARALQVNMPERSLALVTGRVERAAARGRPLAVADGTAGRGARSPITPRRVLAVGLAALLLMGASLALSLMDQATRLMPGWRVAWERALVVGDAQTVGGYTVTLERVYLDPNQLVLAFSTAGPDGARPAVGRSEVTDAQGRHFLAFAGGDIPDEARSLAATVEAFDVPPGIGEHPKLTVRIAELQAVTLEAHAPIEGPWTFTVSPPVTAVTDILLRLTATTAQVPITLEEVRVSPTAVRVHLTADLSAVPRPEPGLSWGADAWIRHGSGPRQPLDWGAFPAAWTGQPKADIGPILDAMDGSEIVRQSTAGTDDPSGAWTLVIERLSTPAGDGTFRSIDGPWTFRWSVP